MSKKQPSILSSDNVMRDVHVTESSSLTINGFVTGKVGRKIELAITTTNVANDTEVYTYKEDGSTVMVLTIVYTNGNRDVLLSVERTA
jgi:hypothetical protein